MLTLSTPQSGPFTKVTPQMGAGLHKTSAAV